MAVVWCSLLVAGCGLVAGCSSSASKSPASSAANGIAAARDPAAGAFGGAAANGGSDAAGAAPAAPVPAQSAAAPSSLTNVAVTSRDLVYTASLTVSVKNVMSATANAENLAAANGGFVGDEKAASDDSSDSPDPSVPAGSGGITQSTVTLRVPSEKFDSVLSQLGIGGKVLQQSRSASDVTDQVVDTASRIKSAQASIDRLDQLMKSATVLTDVVTLENELTTRESDLESLESRQAALQDQVQLSTITATYVLPTAAPATVAHAKKNPFVRGITDGWHAFVAALKVVLIIVGGVLPFLVLAALVAWPVWRIVRSRARRRAAAVAVVATVADGSGVQPHRC